MCCIYMFDSLRDSLAIALIKNGYSLNSTNPDEINVAKEDLIKQKELTSPVYLLDEIKDNMIAGEKALATVYSGDASYSISGNSNLKYAIPQEGSNRWVDSMTIPKGAPNKAGAEAFINFLCDPENAKINVDENNKILGGRLEPGASIGEHTHETNSEIIFFTSGKGKVIYDGKEERVEAGLCHYCPQGHTHILINDSDADLTFHAVIPEHPAK